MTHVVRRVDAMPQYTVANFYRVTMVFERCGPHLN